MDKLDLLDKFQYIQAGSSLIESINLGTDVLFFQSCFWVYSIQAITSLSRVTTSSLPREGGEWEETRKVGGMVGKIWDLVQGG